MTVNEREMKMLDQAATVRDSPSIGEAMADLSRMAADCLWVKWLPFFFGFGE